MYCTLVKADDNPKIEVNVHKSNTSNEVIIRSTCGITAFTEDDIRENIDAFEILGNFIRTILEEE